MYQIWMQVPAEREGFGYDRFVGTVSSHAQASAIARNLTDITGNNVWIEEE